MTDDRIIPFRARADRVVDSVKSTSVAEPIAEGTGRVTMGVEVPADRRLVLTVQTIAQLATIAQDAGVPLDDGLAEGAEKLARNLRGAGLALPVHLEEALDEICRVLSPAIEVEANGVVVALRSSNRALKPRDHSSE